MTLRHDQPGPTTTLPQEKLRSQREQGTVLNVKGTPTVLGWDEVQSVLRDPDTFASDVSAAAMGNVRPAIPLQVDRPEHAGYRRLLHPPFAKARIGTLTPDAQGTAARLIDAFERDGRCDVAVDYIRPFVLQMFMRFAGVAAHHGPEVSQIVDQIIRPPGSETERARRRSAAAHRAYALIERAIDERVADPAEDVLSYLLTAELDGRRLGRTELLDIGFLLLIAGLHSTTDALGCCFAYLATHPDDRHELASNPQVIPTAIDELLRWESPVTAVPRCAKTDTSLGGIPVRAQQTVNVVLAAANTDEGHLEDAFEVDLHRTPNPHVAFGFGIHRCLGIHLAHMEMRVALEEWHQRIPEYTPSLHPEGQGDHRQYVRNVQHLELVWDTTKQAVQRAGDNLDPHRD